MNLNPRLPGAFPSISSLGQPANRPESFAAPIADLRRVKDDLQTQVRRGEITLRVARDTLNAHAESIRGRIRSEGENLQSQQHPLAQRLKEAVTRRRESERAPSLETLQRETNRLLKLNLLEQQIVSRHREFETKTFTRATPTAAPTPTVDSLVAFLEQAANRKDDAAVEWARRQLDTMRMQAATEQERERIERATERPDRPNLRIIDRYLQALAPTEAAERERFVSEALASGEADACIAAYLLARDAAEGIRARWVRHLADGLERFPAEALDAIQQIEARERERLTADVTRDFEHALEAIGRETGLAESLVPTSEHLAHQGRISALPTAQVGESIGLGLSRRGSGPLPTAPSTEPEAPHG